MTERNADSQKDNKPIISEPEYQLITSDRTVGTIYKLGFLVEARQKGLSIEETYNQAITQPHQEEHHDAYRRAKDFLSAHAEEFGLKINNDEDKNI